MKTGNRDLFSKPIDRDDPFLPFDLLSHDQKSVLVQRIQSNIEPKLEPKLVTSQRIRWPEDEQ